MAGLVHAVAHLADAAVHRVDVKSRRVVFDPHLRGREVHVAEQHPIQPSHALLELRRGIGAVHAFHHQLTVTVTLLHLGSRIQRHVLDLGE